MKCRVQYYDLRVILTIIFFSFLYTSHVSAATYTFTKTAGGSWTSSTNWSPNAPAGGPPAGSDIIINPLSNSTKFISGVPTISLNSITCSGSGTAWLQAGSSGDEVTITGTWNVPSGFTLTIGASSARMVWTLNNTSISTIDGYVAFDAGNTNRNFSVYGTLIVNATGCIYDPNPSGGSDFYSYSGSTLKTQKTNGFTRTSAGSAATIDFNAAISFGGSYSYASGTNFEYNGLANQITGAGLSQNTPANITINSSPGTTVTLTANTTMSGTLTLSSGILATSSSSILTLQNAAVAPVLDATATSYIDGPMRYLKNSSGSSTFNFPIGKADDCRPVQLTINHSSSTTYYYIAELFNSSARSLGYTMPASIDTVSDVHYWDITRTNSGGTSTPSTNLSGSQTVSLCFGSNDGVKDLATLKVAKNTSTATTTWTDLAGTSTGSASNGKITSGGFTSFSRFTLAGSAAGVNPLPIELLSFGCQLNEKNKVELRWVTASEKNSQEFLIERSSDGLNFESIGKQLAAGNSLQVLNYIFNDEFPLRDNSYYRLKSVDMDGKFKYSDLCSVTNTHYDNNQGVVFYPNPATHNFTIDFNNSNWTCPNQFTLMDATGRPIEVSSVFYNNKMILDMAGLKEGIYIVEVMAGDKKVFNKVTVQK